MRVEPTPTPFLFNLVGRRFTLEEATEAGKTGNRLVFIGTAFDRSPLLNDLADCVTSPHRLKTPDFQVLLPEEYHSQSPYEHVPQTYPPRCRAPIL